MSATLSPVTSPPLSPLSPLGPTDNLYRCVQPYIPQVDGEIPLNVGDIVAKVKDLGNGWTLGRNASRDTLGIFPSACVVPLADPRPPQPVSEQQQHTTFGELGAHRRAAAAAAAGSSRRDPHRHMPVNTPPINITENLACRDDDTVPDNIISPDSIENQPINSATANLDNFQSHSLPTPRRGKYAVATPTSATLAGKPKLAVKPTQGVERSDMPGSPDQLNEAPPLPPTSTPRMLPKVATAAVASSSTQPRTRVSAPPGQLPLTNVANPESNITDMEKAVGPDSLTLPVTTSAAAALAAGGTLQDRSTSPILLPLSTHSNNLPDLTHMDIVEQENRANEIKPDEQFADIKNQRRYYQDYRTLDCPAPVMEKQYSLRYKPILKHQKVADSKGQHIYYREPQQPSKSSRLVLSVLAGMLIGFLLFLWMYFYLGYSFMVAVAGSSVTAVMLCIGFALSRLCRCTGALLLPSLCTTRGRISFLILITGFLLGGPVTNVYFNMAEISRSMACSAEQSYNQTMLLLEPFDAMMRQLDHTIHVLQSSAHQVSVGLQPLDDGLEVVEMDLINGRLQLMGTQMTCKTMVDRAFNECATGVFNAQEQCLNVISALGTVYVQAKDVLDRINPERWAPKQQHLFKRQIITAGGTVDEESEQDICEPLNTILVCQSLNNSDSLCRPSRWAGEAIQDAINTTQSAMKKLKRALQFQVDPGPYYNTRSNASRMLYEVRKKVDKEFSGRTQYFQLVVGILMKLTPLGILLLIYVAYLHIKHYMSKDTYDNVYVTDNFKALDQKRSEVAGDTLFPLKKCELNCLIDTTISDLSPQEDGLYRLGLCVLGLHLLVSFTCYIFDYILYWVLALIEHHSSPTFDVTGQAALEQVVDGEGVIVELLDVFLQGFHPGTLYGFSANTNECLPKPTTPSIIYLLVIFIMYFVLILTILLKAYILRFRNKITGYFYPERQKARIVHLYNVLLNQRARMPRMLQQKAKMAHRERVLQEQVSLLHKMAARCAPCRIFLYQSATCLVCNTVEDQNFRDCDTEKCGGVYCNECYEDLRRVCPLCLHGMGMEYSDDDDNYEELEDDLQPYCRSSKIYL